MTFNLIRFDLSATQKGPKIVEQETAGYDSEVRYLRARWSCEETKCRVFNGYKGQTSWKVS